MNLTTFVQDERLRSRLATVLDLSGAARRTAAPVVDLLVRLALAKAFFAPGMFPGIGAADFATAWPMINELASPAGRRRSQDASVASKVILAFRSLDTGQPSFTPHSGPPSTALRSIELMESGPSHLRRFVQ